MSTTTCNAVMLNSTIYGDGELIVKNGEFIHKELQDIVNKLR